MDLTILQGDCREKLKELPDASVHCVVTSPPYWGGLRDYGTPAQVWGGATDCQHEWGDQLRAPWANELPGPNGRKKNVTASRQRPKEAGSFCQKCDAWRGSLGLEPTPELYARNLVLVFRDVWRALRSDGTLWLNMGDTYASGGKGGGGSFMAERREASWQRQSKLNGWRSAPPGLKSKDLAGIPWMVAFALRADGWWLRSEIIWHKTNPFPESVTDRPTKAHEQIFLLTKSANYFYDADAISEPCSPNTHARVSQDVATQIGSARANGGAKTNGNMKAVIKGGVNPKAAANAYGSRQNESFSAATCLSVTTRNKRTVWSVGSKPYSGAHFATYPPDLIRPCILAGCPSGGVVLDPFAGSGTTGAVALELGRLAILIELNPDYVKLIKKRCRVNLPLMFEETRK